MNHYIQVFSEAICTTLFGSLQAVTLVRFRGLFTEDSEAIIEACWLWMELGDAFCQRHYGCTGVTRWWKLFSSMYAGELDGQHGWLWQWLMFSLLVSLWWCWPERGDCDKVKMVVSPLLLLIHCGAGCEMKSEPSKERWKGTGCQKSSRPPGSRPPGKWTPNRWNVKCRKSKPNNY